MTCLHEIRSKVQLSWLTNKYINLLLHIWKLHTLWSKRKTAVKKKKKITTVQILVLKLPEKGFKLSKLSMARTIISINSDRFSCYQLDSIAVQWLQLPLKVLTLPGQTTESGATFSHHHAECNSTHTTIIHNWCTTDCIKISTWMEWEAAFQNLKPLHRWTVWDSIKT